MNVGASCVTDFLHDMVFNYNFLEALGLWMASAVNAAVILFVIVAGFVHANTSNMTPSTLWGKGVFQGAAVVYFAYG